MMNLCSRCGKPRRLWLPPRYRRGFAAGDWRISAAGNPLISNNTISIGEDCCCCITCCEEGTSPPQIELDTTGIVPNPFIGCGAACAAFEDVFLLDFRSTRTTDTPEHFGAGICLWRYCNEFECDGTTVPFGWDVSIQSSGLECRATAHPWIGGGCGDFTMTGSGATDAVYYADLPTDPDDCCDALSSPFTLDPSPATGITGSIFNIDFAGGCDILGFLVNTVTIQAVGC